MRPLVITRVRLKRARSLLFTQRQLPHAYFASRDLGQERLLQAPSNCRHGFEQMDLAAAIQNIQRKESLASATVEDKVPLLHGRTVLLVEGWMCHRVELPVFAADILQGGVSGVVDLFVLKAKKNH